MHIQRHSIQSKPNFNLFQVQANNGYGADKQEKKTMTFVNEYISVADKTRIDFSKIKHPVHHNPIISTQWTVDHEHDIALIPLGTFGEPQTRTDGVEERTYVFVLYWQGQVVEVLLYGSYTGNFTSGDLEVTWRINCVGLPTGMPLRFDCVGAPAGVSREEVLNVLKEALFAYGYETTRLRDKVKAIHIAF